MPLGECRIHAGVWIHTGVLIIDIAVIVSPVVVVAILFLQTQSANEPLYIDRLSLVNQRGAVCPRICVRMGIKITNISASCISLSRLTDCIREWFPMPFLLAAPCRADNGDTDDADDADNAADGLDDVAVGWPGSLTKGDESGCDMLIVSYH